MGVVVAKGPGGIVETGVADAPMLVAGVSVCTLVVVVAVVT